MNMTTKQQNRKLAIRMAIYTAVWIIFAVTLYHLIKR